MANMVNVLNTILSNASAMYQERVPTATRDNLADIGEVVLNDEDIKNEFLNTLVNKIALQIVHNKTFRNPLAVLKKGSVPLGRNIEEIYTNPVTGTIYDATGADLLKRELPDVKTIYHTMNRQGKYKTTVSHSQLTAAFRSYADMEKLLNSIVNSIYSGDNIDEYLLMKQLFANAITSGKIKTVNGLALPENEETSKALVKAIKTTGLSMTNPSTAFNTYYDVNKGTDAKPVITWTPLENQILLLRNDVAVNMDVEMLAKAFNVSYVDFAQRTLLVDSFGTDQSVLAVLCDEAYVQVRDHLQQMKTFENGEGLYHNYIYHHWQSYSLSLFANAVAFTTVSETES